MGRRGLAALIGFVVIACSAPSTPPQPTGSSAAVGNPSSQSAGATSIPNASAPPEPVTAQELIEAAHDSGRIDLVTSLVYRGEALFGLPGLPPEFAGATPAFEDNGLFAEIIDLLPTLSAADQARLKPFVVRPTDPASIFAGGATAVTGSSVTLTSYTSPTNAIDECRDWVDSGSASPHFKVWTCVTANAADDQAVVSSVAATMDDLWSRMTPLAPNGMGEPVPDGRSATPGAEFGGDQRIDVYVVKLDQSVFREGKQRSILAAAVEIPSEPFTGNTASGFMLVNRGRLADPDFRNDLIHEFFHILEMAHNYRAMFNSAGQLQWFEDASATWAESFYGQSVVVHGWFHDFQASPLSLASSDGPHPQEAYIWPIFMEQEAGASAIFNAWAQIDGVAPADFAGVNAVIDAQLSFKDHFRDFAMRNLNKDVLGQVTVPGPEKRYQQLVPSIPGTYWPPIDEQSISADTPTSWTPTSMPALTARYLHLTDSAPGGNVTLDLSGLTPSDSLDADVLVHVKDHWERRQVDGTPVHLLPGRPGRRHRPAVPGGLEPLGRPVVGHQWGRHHQGRTVQRLAGHDVDRGVVGLLARSADRTRVDVVHRDLGPGRGPLEVHRLPAVRRRRARSRARTARSSTSPSGRSPGRSRPIASTGGRRSIRQHRGGDRVPGPGDRLAATGPVPPQDERRPAVPVLGRR